MTSDVAASSSGIEALAAEAKRLSARLRMREEAIRRLLRSTSWRVTAPLRRWCDFAGRRNRQPPVRVESRPPEGRTRPPRAGAAPRRRLAGVLQAAGPRVLPRVLLALRKAADAYHGAASAYVFAVRRKAWSDAARSLRSIADRPGSAPRYPNDHHVRARRLQRARIDSPAYRVTKSIFRAVAPPGRIVWVRPRDVVRKASNDLTLYYNDVLPGDWDLRTETVDTRVSRAMVQHFRDGSSWEETDLFKDKYASLIEGGGAFRRTRDASGLKRYYERRFDALYADVREHGYQVSFGERGLLDVPHVHVARDGGILLGNNGNHRLMIAKLLGVERIPCHVRARHLAWQLHRERVAAADPERRRAAAGRRFAAHPDLDDLCGPDEDRSGAPDPHDVVCRAPTLRGTRAGLLLRRLARDAPDGTSIVQVGCWLGAETAQLALGLRERRDPEAVRMHCYDRWQATGDDAKRAARRGMRLRPGDDRRPLVRSRLEPLRLAIGLHDAARGVAPWKGGPISVYVDDSESPELFHEALRRFGRSWIPGRTVVAFMDVRLWNVRKRVLESAGRCFEPLGADDQAVFLYKDAARFDRLAAEAEVWSLRTRLAARDEELRALKASTSWRVTAPLRRCRKAARTWAGRRRRRSAGMRRA